MMMVETIKPEWPKTEVRNILRWEDDGGPVLETGNPPLPQLAEIKTPRPMDVAGDDL